MIFTKLLPVAVVESALAFCFNIFPYKFSAPFSRFFFLPSTPLGLVSSSIFCAPFYSPLSPTMEPGTSLSQGE